MTQAALGLNAVTIITGTSCISGNPETGENVSDTATTVGLPYYSGFIRVQSLSNAVFTARRYASAVLSSLYMLYVCPTFVRPSHAGIVSKQLNIGSRNQR